MLACATSILGLVLALAPMFMYCSQFTAHSLRLNVWQFKVKIASARVQPRLNANATRRNSIHERVLLRHRGVADNGEGGRAACCGGAVFDRFRPDGRVNAGSCGEPATVSVAAAALEALSGPSFSRRDVALTMASLAMRAAALWIPPGVSLRPPDEHATIAGGAVRAAGGDTAAGVVTPDSCLAGLLRASLVSLRAACCCCRCCCCCCCCCC